MECLSVQGVARASKGQGTWHSDAQGQQRPGSRGGSFAFTPPSVSSGPSPLGGAAHTVGRSCRLSPPTHMTIIPKPPRETRSGHARKSHFSSCRWSPVVSQHLLTLRRPQRVEHVTTRGEHSRGPTKEDFRRSHPGGWRDPGGKQLSQNVKAITPQELSVSCSGDNQAAEGNVHLTSEERPKEKTQLIFSLCPEPAAFAASEPHSPS
ncbi:uncharacterized protein LOC117284484 [Fukomys damarensis]|uniref:uncharacterized protein LOC117284484 n=1 Tax=Fukomys damarensis TaxID=885580 RepID=UPI0014555E89|nr:uncharacterized protein LOC117284484 [Fukomys damarensis]